jgi:integration host factor subunit alpha
MAMERPDPEELPGARGPAGWTASRLEASLMTKAEIVEHIYERVGFSKKEAAEVVESIFEVIKARLEQGEKVKISGFGNFVINEKRPRKGRNPQTGDEIVISGRRVLSFKPSQVLKRTINADEAHP